MLCEQTLGKLDEFMHENEVTGTCANGVCTVHGPHGKSEYSEVFEQFVPAFFAGAQDVDSLMDAAKTIGESGDMKAMQQLAEKHQVEIIKLQPLSSICHGYHMLLIFESFLQKDAQTRMAPIITQIFDQFVPSRSPGVDPEICRALVQEFLTACQRHMPLLAKQSMEAGMKMGSAMSGGALDASTMMQMEQGMKAYMPQITKTMQAVLVELLARSDKMADDIFEAMDVNKDGIVPRKEFEKEFLTSMQTIVNMQALAQTAQKVMENLTESDLEQLRSLVDPEMLKQLSQMDPDMLLEQLKAIGGPEGLQNMMQERGGLGGMPGMGGAAGGRRGRVNSPLGGRLK
jgi:hypothetical protein